MDTSKKYVKMCEKAEEIQCGWNPQVGDFYYHKVYKESYCYRDACPDPMHPKEDGVWLPRQDQLQEMIGVRNFNGASCSMQALSLPYKMKSWEIGKWYTMEQVFLMAVMHEKHNKIWTGEEWANNG